MRNASRSGGSPSSAWPPSFCSSRRSRPRSGSRRASPAPSNDVLFFAFFIMFGIGIPVAAGIAVMRYRLWELDVILKKTIVATVLVVLLTIVSLVVLIAVGGIVVGPLSDSPGIALLAGIGVGALTWPLLRLSRRIADRFVYGTRATPVRGAHAVLRPDGRVVRDRRRAASDGVDPGRRHRAPGASRSGCSWATNSDPPRRGSRADAGDPTRCRPNPPRRRSSRS